MENVKHTGGHGFLALLLVLARGRGTLRLTRDGLMKNAPCHSLLVLAIRSQVVLGKSSIWNILLGRRRICLGRLHQVGVISGNSKALRRFSSFFGRKILAMSSIRRFVSPLLPMQLQTEIVVGALVSPFSCKEYLTWKLLRRMTFPNIVTHDWDRVPRRRTITVSRNAISPPSLDVPGN